MKSFASGRPELDRFFQKHAMNNAQLGLSKTYVLERLQGDVDSPRIVGFHAIAMANVSSTKDMEKVMKTKLPRYPSPVGLIAQLASHEKLRGLGIGEHLLIDALKRIGDLSKHIGCVAAVTDAIDENAEQFYVKYGFQVLDPKQKYPRRLAIALKLE